MQQNQFPRLSTHWPKFISPGATKNHSNPFSTWQPFSLLKITNHVPPSPLFSRLNRPSAPLKNKAGLSFHMPFSKKQKVFYQPQLNHLFSTTGPQRQEDLFARSRPDTQRDSIPFGIPLEALSWDVSNPSSEAHPVTVAFFSVSPALAGKTSLPSLQHQATKNPKEHLRSPGPGLSAWSLW